MCECCDNVVRDRRSAEQTKLSGKTASIRIAAVTPKPRTSRTSIAVADEKARTAVEETAAG